MAERLVRTRVGVGEKTAKEVDRDDVARELAGLATGITALKGYAIAEGHDPQRRAAIEETFAITRERVRTLARLLGVEY